MLTRETRGGALSASRRSAISDFVEFDPAYAIKFTIYRADARAAAAGDPDIFGAQQYAPLLTLSVPD